MYIESEETSHIYSHQWMFILKQNSEKNLSNILDSDNFADIIISENFVHCKILADPSFERPLTPFPGLHWYHLSCTTAYFFAERPTFLALLDSVSRADSIWDFVRRPSVVLLAVGRLWHLLLLKLLHGYFFQILAVASPGPYAQTLGFLFFFYLIFLRFYVFFVFINMGPYGSQNFKTLLLPQITFESFPTFF